jgi:hypothetical protein
MSAQIQTRGFVLAGIQFANCGTDVLESYKRPCFFLPWRGNDSHHKKFLSGGTSKLTVFPSNSDVFFIADFYANPFLRHCDSRVCGEIQQAIL